MYIKEAKEAIAKEIDGLTSLMSNIDDSFNMAVNAILECSHHVVISGMGKAGLIGSKISATLASTGTPSFFMHPAEAIHGDFGMLKKEDIVILMSFGGETEEITKLIPMLKLLGNKTIAITKSKTSTLGSNSDIVIEIGEVTEACPMGLAPTTSTTAMLALGDALAVILLKKHNFNEKKYAFFHPGGSLGKKLLKVEEVMRQNEKCLILIETLPVKDVILAVSKARSGVALLTSKKGYLTGVFTDGDLRRLLNKNLSLDIQVKDIMTKNPKIIHNDYSALEAIRIMKEHMIGDLAVLNEKDIPIGILNLKDLVNIGLLYL